MKYFVFATFVAQAIFQLTNAQAIRAVNVAAPLVSSCGNQIISPCGNQILSPCGNQIISPCGNQIISACGNQILSPYANQYISPCASPIIGSCGCGGPIISPVAPVISPVAPVIASQAIIQPSVANSLADTLSLLTVSSLLADALPLGSNVLVPGCGCGGYGYGAYGGLYY